MLILKNQLNEIVMRKVREIEGIKKTLTMIIIASKDPKETEKESRYSYLNLFIIT